MLRAGQGTQGLPRHGMGSREGLWAFLHCTAKAAQRESQLPLLCKESDLSTAVR